MYLVATYKLSLMSVILRCDGPIVLCSTVVMYLDICIGQYMPSPQCGIQWRCYDDERERERERKRREREKESVGVENRGRERKMGENNHHLIVQIRGIDYMSLAAINTSWLDSILNSARCASSFLGVDKHPRGRSFAATFGRILCPPAVHVSTATHKHKKSTFIC